MKKLLSLLLCLLLLGSLTLPAMAAGEEPQIILQPQNYQYPEYSVAIYTVKAAGQNLKAEWYLEFEGEIYNLSDNQNAFEPWEAYAGENYGPMENGPDTFSWFFGGIESGLNGAEIWCVLEDGHYDVTSRRAMITVQGGAMPPEILQMPAALTVSQDGEAELRCVAKSGSDAQLSFQWYETATGKLPDIRAIDGEDSDFLFCDTKNTGTRYYVCCVSDSRGGMTYSSVVPVTVETGTAQPVGKEPTFLTKTLPQGTAGEDYGFTLETDDHSAEFSVAYNPGGANDFEKTGLKLSVEGMLMGKLKEAGTYTFTVCVANAYGEDYGVLTLTVGEKRAADPTATAATELQPSVTEPEPTQSTDAAPTQPLATQPVPEKFDPAATQLPWWGYLLVIIGGAATGVGIALIVWKRKKQ